MNIRYKMKSFLNRYAAPTIYNVQNHRMHVMICYRIIQSYYFDAHANHPVHLLTFPPESCSHAASQVLPAQTLAASVLP